ncbi:DUF397 domain-containing protein [Streptomyces cahuitamycinicus]|uniref:DUF397 domain-containing protein n=1 Tax=Streptomyces cahuitamycinicus TaxID=2070367 RepID=A0A2N8TSX6_9ACTN|nr:DUF397 domain-containing protein [Streptomyces cahuitamycinicus]PNG22119.1 DUF397 domain-containing protein [Streptomyces cahuitamycinicus]
MPTHRWQKSSYCQEGEACVHISVSPDTVHITDRPDPPHVILTTSHAAFRALVSYARSATTAA